MITLTGIRSQVFLDRYALKNKQGKPVEKHPQEMWQRVAKGVAVVEKPSKRDKWAKEFYGLMEGFKFVPGGRVLMGAGTDHTVTFYNCFVIPSPQDSRGGILETLKMMTEIMARGGGVGFNLSGLRPRGSSVSKVNGTSSGPVNWAEVYSVMTHDIIQQGGCFAPDTKIMTHRGLVSAKEIMETKSNFFAVTHQGYKRITAKFNNGEKDIYEVKTKAGFRVKVTALHKLMTFNDKGEFYLKPLKDFKIGEQVTLLLGDWIEDLPYISLNTNLSSPSKYSNNLKKIKLPTDLDEDLAFILGVYDADGSKIPDEYCLNGKGIRIAIDSKRKQDLQTLIDCIGRVFGVEPKVRDGDGAVKIVQVFSRRLNEFLKLNSLLKESSVNVGAPEQIFTSPKSVVEAYIAGVLLGDGTNRGGKGGLRIATVSERFAQQLQLLLLNLGVASKIKVRKRRTKNWRTIYTVTVNGATFMKRFIRLLAPYTEKVFDKKISVRDGFFGWPFNLADRFVYVPHFQRTMARTNPTTSQKAVLFLQQRTSVLNTRDMPDVEILASCIPDTIVSITLLGKSVVYDFEVDGVHRLSGNGFYTSNSRRGALMLMLWDWHPDIEEFITVKKNLRRLLGANLSVCISDKFMEAVKQDKDWRLVFPDTNDPDYDQLWTGDLEEWRKKGKKVREVKRVKARQLWNLIAESAWASAEPGVVFMDRVNKFSNTYYFEKLISTNPCGEQPLPAFGVCNLGAMNLVAYVTRNPKFEARNSKQYQNSKFPPAGRAGKIQNGNNNENGETDFDFETLAKDVKTAVRFMDNVIDAENYIYPQMRERQMAERRIGLGTMGLADALILLKLRYGSPPALAFIKQVYQTIRDSAYLASIELAKEKGAFPRFQAQSYLRGGFIKTLGPALRNKIKKFGIRNCTLLTQAPTGKTSLLAGVSSGIEPVFAFEYKQKDRLGERVMRHWLYEKYMSGQGYRGNQGNQEKATDQHSQRPAYLVTASQLTPEEHVRTQATIQHYTDSSISKTVNAPNHHRVADVKKLYQSAYDLGCKGITYMRAGSRKGMLEQISGRSKKELEKVKLGRKLVPEVKPRPSKVTGVTYRLETPVGETFVTINENGQGEPFEMFVTVGKSGSDVSAMAEGLGRLSSLILRLASPLTSFDKMRQIFEQLVGIGGARAVGFGQKRVRSLPDAIAKIIATHFGFKVKNGNGTGNNVEMSAFDLCPKCGQASLVYEEGCRKCYGCGYTEC